MYRGGRRGKGRELDKEISWSRRKWRGREGRVKRVKRKSIKKTVSEEIKRRVCTVYGHACYADLKILNFCHICCRNVLKLHRVLPCRILFLFL